jgi:hypothetical protein
MNDEFKNLPGPLDPAATSSELMKAYTSKDNLIYDRVDVYLYNLKQMVLQKERTQATYQTYENAYIPSLTVHYI